MKYPFALLVLVCAMCGGGRSKVGELGGGAGDLGSTDVYASEQVKEEWEQSYPDPGFVHVVRSAPRVSASDTYAIDEPVQFSSPDLDVRSIAWVAGTLWVGTSKGLARYTGEGFEAAALHGVTVSDIGRGLCAGGSLPVIAAGAVQFVDPANGAVQAVVQAGESVAVECKGDKAYVGAAGGGLFEVTGWEGQPKMVKVLDTAPVRDIAVSGTGGVWVATDKGLVAWDGQSEVAVNSLLDNDVRAVTPFGSGVVAGSSKGLSFILPEGNGKMEAKVGGLPTDCVRAISCVKDVCLVGHEVGATYFRVGDAFTPVDINHYVSGRWLPSNEVRAVALAEPGVLFVGTAAGISRIQWNSHTFAEKAKYMEDLQGHFWRLGFVPSDVQTDDPWNPTTWRVWDHDNDGLWTQMQIGAWCYAYAVTKDETYYQKARKAMDVMFLQIDVPAVDFVAAGLGRGFITRSLVRDDEGAVFEDKKTRPNWHLVHYKDSHDYYWKDDTSSDETTGHFFGFPLFYDLCAKDDAERAAVAEHAAALAGYIVDHGFRLVDLDGEPTTFGHFEPERLAAAADGLEVCLQKGAEDPGEMVTACAGSWYGEGWLNSIEIMGHLLATWHMTGDKRFYDAYDALYTIHKYDKVSMPHSDTVTITKPPMMNHSDHELAMLAYHTLIRYEPNPERRQRFIEGLRFLYDWERGERNPLWAAFVALLDGPETADIEEALQSLREIPFDRRDWLVDNSHRKDANMWPDDRHGRPQFDRVFPYDEIGTVWWNANFHRVRDGSDGRTVKGPMAWLLPYWAFRYAGIIGE